MAVVGISRWVLHLPGCRSLKMKRSVVRGLRDRMIAKFHVSAAETDLQDRASTAELSACVISGDLRHAQSVMTSVDSFVRSDPRAQVVEAEVEFL